MKKVIGKITSAEFGLLKKYPFLLGLQLRFSFEPGIAEDYGTSTRDFSEENEWKDIDGFEITEDKNEYIIRILKEAKVNYVSQLIGKSVEIIFDKKGVFDFYMLAEA